MPDTQKATIVSPNGEGEWSGDPEAIDELKKLFARESARDPNSIKSRFFIRGEISGREAIKELARTFPSLAGLPMFQPGSGHHFDGDVMDAFRGGLCHGGQ